jgi:hypothetical protein
MQEDLTAATTLLAQNGYSPTDSDPTPWTKAEQAVRLLQDGDSLTATQITLREGSEHLIATFRLGQVMEVFAAAL